MRTRLGPVIGVAIVALLAVDVGLVAQRIRASDAFRSAPQSTQSPAPRPAKTIPDSPAPSTARATASPSTSGAHSASKPVTIHALDDRHAWRTYSGTCEKGGSVIERTADGGKSWTSVQSPLRALVRLQPRSFQAAFIVGADDKCETKLLSTADGGSNWARSADPARSWYVSPDDRHQVNGPGAVRSEPCGGAATVQDLAVYTTGGARVLCQDGSVLQTADFGRTWTPTGRVPGAAALAVPPAHLDETYTVGTGVGCRGVQVVRVAEPNDVLSCLDLDQEPDHRHLSLSLSPQGAWLAVDHNIFQSDDLMTWAASSRSSSPRE